jgi:hypothetical protein
LSPSIVDSQNSFLIQLSWFSWFVTIQIFIYSPFTTHHSESLCKSIFLWKPKEITGQSKSTFRQTVFFTYFVVLCTFLKPNAFFAALNTSSIRDFLSRRISHPWYTRTIVWPGRNIVFRKFLLCAANRNDCHDLFQEEPFWVLSFYNHGGIYFSLKSSSKAIFAVYSLIFLNFEVN